MTEVKSNNQSGGSVESRQSPFVGRERAWSRLMDAVVEHEDRPESSRVTVVGPPGVGKSRLVGEFVTSRPIREAYESVVWASLAGADDRRAVIRTVAEAMAVPSEPGETDDEIEGRVRRRFENDDLLVVLDNLEQVADAAGTLVETWSEAGATLVGTSRVPLGVAREDVIRLAGLDAGNAVDLFESRAQRVRPGFAVDGSNRASVEKLVEMLDRFPLAIELAASRTRTLPPAELCEQLEHRFRLLRRSRDDDQPVERPERHRSMEVAVDWSWSLLDAPQRRALAQCSVCRGTFGLELAREMIDAPEGEWVVDLLDDLVRHSLVRSRHEEGHARFEVYHSVAAYGRREQLEATDEAAGAKRRYARSVVHLAESDDARIGPQGTAVTEENLRGAYELADGLNGGAAELTFRLGRHLDRVMRRRGGRREHAELVERLSALVDDSNGARADGLGVRQRILALEAKGYHHQIVGRLDRAGECYRRSLSLAEDNEFPRLAAVVADRLAEVERTRGRVEEAQRFSEEGLSNMADVPESADAVRASLQARRAAACVRQQMSVEAERALEAAEDAIERNREPSDSWGDWAVADVARRRAEALQRMAFTAYYLERHDDQRRWVARALDLAETAVDARLQALSRQSLGDWAVAVSRLARAEAEYREALEMHEELGNERYAAVLAGNLAHVLHRRGEPGEARRAYRRAIDGARRTEARPYEAVARFGRAVLAFERGHVSTAREGMRRVADIYDELGRVEDAGGAEIADAWMALSEGSRRIAEQSAARAVSLFEASDAETWRDFAGATTALASGDGAADIRDGLERTAEDRAMSESERWLARMLAGWLGVELGGDAWPETALQSFRRRTGMAEEETTDGAAADMYERTLATAIGRAKPGGVESSLEANAAPISREDSTGQSSRAEAGRASGGDPRETDAASEEQPEAVKSEEDLDMIVGEEARWFRVRPHRSRDVSRSNGSLPEAVDLSRRGAIRRIFERLVRRHRAADSGDAPEPLDVHEAFDVGWPDQTIDPDAAADRVYWAIRELRKAGLEGWLQTTDRGYRLRPSMALARSQPNSTDIEGRDED